MSGAPADVTAVVVNFDSGGRLARLLDGLKDQVRDVVVVDNASSDRSDEAAAGRERVSLIRNASNTGFAAAANQGAERATGSWILFANPDTHPGPGVVRLLTTYVPDDVAAVAPVQTGGRRNEPLPETGGHDPSLARFMAWALLPGRTRSDRGPWLSPPFPQTDFFPDWVSGAFMAVRRNAFERIRGFDDRFFMFQEDAELCRRLRTSGHRIMCRGWVRVPHEVAQGDRDRRAEEAGRAIASLAMRFEGWRRKVLGAALLVGFLARSVFGQASTRRSSRKALTACLRLLGRD